MLELDEATYLRHFLFRMRWLREVGMVQRTNMRWSHRKPVCESGGTDFSSIGLTEIMPLLVFFTYGIIISVLLVFLEIAVHPRSFIRKNFQKCSKVCKKKQKERRNNKSQKRAKDPFGYYLK